MIGHEASMNLLGSDALRQTQKGEGQHQSERGGMSDTHEGARAPGACGRRHFFGPLPVGSLQTAKSDRRLDENAEADRGAFICRPCGEPHGRWLRKVRSAMKP